MISRPFFSVLRRTIVGVCLWAATSGAARAQIERDFDGARAFEHVRRQVEFGPRPSGSMELQRTRDYLKAELRAAGLEVEEQAFTEMTPRGPIRFVNLLAHSPRPFLAAILHPSSPTVIVASHYDTKWMPGIRFVGANDGASSTAVLLEMARVAARWKLEPWGCRLEFVFFDGEEATENYSPTDGLHGSRHYVAEARQHGQISQIRRMILLDMIGDRDLSVLLPQADPELMRRVFDAAAALGFRDSFRYASYGMVDDHSPFALEGVPAVDLIDFEYGPQNRWWHTAEDTPDKLSPASLEIVGKTVLRMLSAP